MNPLILGAAAVFGYFWWRGHAETAAQRIEQERAACALLGVPRGASRDAITRAHRMAMRDAHPDHGGTESHAKAINAARDLLLKR